MKQTYTNSRVIIYFVYLFYQKEKSFFLIIICNFTDIQS